MGFVILVSISYQLHSTAAYSWQLVHFHVMFEHSCLYCLLFSFCQHTAKELGAKGLHALKTLHGSACVKQYTLRITQSAPQVHRKNCSISSQTLPSRLRCAVEICSNAVITVHVRTLLRQVLTTKFFSRFLNLLAKPGKFG